MQEQKHITIQPGVFATIAAGFDLTAKHLWLLLLPVILDTFFWLGPRLRFQKIIEQLVALLPKDADLLNVGSQILEIAPRTNLFTTLTVQLIGVPALMVGQVPEKTPIPTQTLEINGWLNWIGLLLIFSLIGLLLTALYYTLIAYAISTQTSNGESLGIGWWVKRVGTGWLRLIALALFFFLIVFIIYIPLITISTILFFINGTVGSIVLLSGPFFLIWFTIFMFLAPFGIILNGRPVLRAVMESVRLVQTNLASALFLILIVLLVGTVLDWLLFSVESGTWLTLINILGHAFVSTALVAAIFLFYRDRYAALFDSEAALIIQSSSEK